MPTIQNLKTILQGSEPLKLFENPNVQTPRTNDLPECSPQAYHACNVNIFSSLDLSHREFANILLRPKAPSTTSLCAFGIFE